MRRIILWTVDIVGAHHDHHYLVAAPDWLLARGQARAEAGRETGRNAYSAEAYVTRVHEYPADTTRVGRAIAERDARLAGVDLEVHRPLLAGGYLVADIAEEQRLLEACGCGRDEAGDDHRSCHLIDAR